MVKDYQPATQGTYCYCYDGNGNVTALVNADNGAVAARYEYGPFGELLRATGPMAFVNPFRFSTKYQDEESGFLYYGYRYYDPTVGRWASRDPLEEKGGLNLFGFVYNSPRQYIDRNGLDIFGIGEMPKASDVVLTPSGAYIGDPSSSAIAMEGLAGAALDLGKVAAPKVETIIWVFVPNPVESYKTADRAWATAANPDVPKEFRVAAAAAGVSVTVLGVVELIPAVKAATGPLRSCLCKTTKGIIVKTERKVAAKAPGDTLKLATTSEGSSVNGIELAKRLSDQEMQQLQKKCGTEFAQVYVTGPGPNGSGGKTYLIQGVEDRVWIPIRKDVRFINHTHPDVINGKKVPLRHSEEDLDVLDLLRKAGSPQKSSTVIPESNGSFRFTLPEGK